MSSVAPFSVAQQSVQHPSNIIKCLDHDTSPPLRDMVLIKPGEGELDWERGEVPNPTLFEKSFEDLNAAGQNLETDPVVQDEPGDLPAKQYDS